MRVMVPPDLMPASLQTVPGMSESRITGQAMGQLHMLELDRPPAATRCKQLLQTGDDVLAVCAHLCERRLQRRSQGNATEHLKREQCQISVVVDTDRWRRREKGV